MTDNMKKDATQKKQHSDSRTGAAGNFANDPERARREGQKGGRS